MEEQIWIFIHQARFWVAYFIINACFLYGACVFLLFLMGKTIEVLGLKKQILDAAFKIIKERKQEEE